MNSSKSIQQASQILNQILINSNLANIVTSYLMTDTENKNIIKIQSGVYINVSSISKIEVFRYVGGGASMDVYYGGDHRCLNITNIRTNNKELGEKIVLALSNSELIKEFYEAFGK